MKFSFTKNFVRKYRKLPSKIQHLTDKQLELLISDPKHPSLNIKKMKDPRDIWRGKITDSHRFTFQIKEGCYILRNIGSHDILKKP